MHEKQKICQELTVHLCNTVYCVTDIVVLHPYEKPIFINTAARTSNVTNYLKFSHFVG